MLSQQPEAELSHVSLSLNNDHILGSKNSVELASTGMQKQSGFMSQDL
jgi:hypothetical protein